VRSATTKRKRDKIVPLGVLPPAKGKLGRYVIFFYRARSTGCLYHQTASIAQFFFDLRRNFLFITSNKHSSVTDDRRLKLIGENIFSRLVWVD